MPQVRAERTGLSSRTTKFFLALIAASLLIPGASRPAQSQTYQVIHNFTGKGSDGATPYGGPTLDKFGNVYGTTYLGGTFGAGSVYRLAPGSGGSWTYNSLYSLKAGSDGSGPAFGTLAIRSECVLFGTTEGGGFFGTAFKVRATTQPCGKSKGPWQETVVHSFGTGQDGAQPIGGVAFDSAGNFYGTTSLGGANGNGTVFQVTPAGVESVIYSFIGGNDGFNPVAGVTVDSKGNLYGTTSLGGANGDGVVYMLSPNGSGWTQIVLYTFQGQSDGQNPVGGVVLDGEGNIFGGTLLGGVNGGGTVYELSPVRGGGYSLTTLYSFSTYYGPYNKLTLDASGNIYGTANGAGAHGLGSVFKLTFSNGTWTFTDLYDFTGGTDGGSPYGSVAVDPHGNIFGTAVVGGSDNQGVVFEITP